MYKTHKIPKMQSVLSYDNDYQNTARRRHEFSSCINIEPINACNRMIYCNLSNKNLQEIEKNCQQLLTNK